MTKHLKIGLMLVLLMLLVGCSAKPLVVRELHSLPDHAQTLSDDRTPLDIQQDMTNGDLLSIALQLMLDGGEAAAKVKAVQDVKSVQVN